MKRFFLALAFAAFCPAVAAASSMALVEGKIVDATTGQPLPGVQVTVQSRSGTAQATSDSRGFYTVWDAPLGQATLSFSHEGFVQTAGFVCLHPGATNTSTIALFDRLGHDAGRADFAQWRRLSRDLFLDETTSATWLGPC